MGITEILLLLLGISVFVVSFVVPEKKEKMREADKRLSEAQIQSMLEEQMKSLKIRVSDVVEETTVYAVEKAERSMERLSNEKIMAVNEYSDTVLEAIHKNNEEVVFLYDMLNEKQQSLKETVADAERRTKDALQQLRDAEADIRIESEAMGTEEILEPAEPEVIPPPLPKLTGIEVIRAGRPEAAGILVKTEKPVKKSPANPALPASAAISEVLSAPMERGAGEIPAVALSFASSGEDGQNNNEKILALHRAGKSNMAIAKELGLGIGEVKLVIDLFKGV